MEFRDLTPEVRVLMREEFKRDGEEPSDLWRLRLTSRGERDFARLMREAISHGDSNSLAEALELYGRLKEREYAHRGSLAYEKKAPSNAARLLAEGEFNRLYIRAVCLRALELGKTHVFVYRARPSAHPRPESEEKIGHPIDAKALLEDLRTNPPEATRFGVPEVGGGLSVHL